MSDPCSTAGDDLLDDDAARLREHLLVVAIDDSGWSRTLSCAETGIGWAEDYPFSEMQGGGPVRLRRLPLQPACRCADQTLITGPTGVVYSREHLTWVRYLGDGHDLFVCKDRHAYWDSAHDPAVAGGATGWYAERVWYSSEVASDPMLSTSLARPI